MDERPGASDPEGPFSLASGSTGEWSFFARNLSCRVFRNESNRATEPGSESNLDFFSGPAIVGPGFVTLKENS
jgi:hypothetical protein